MGLTAAFDSWLARLGSTRLHVLVVETPGFFAVRAVVERSCLGRGWVIALAPADADALVVCGAPEGVVADAVEQLWSALPGPRVRAEIGTVHAVDQALDALAVGYRAWDSSTDPGSSAQPVEQTGGTDQGGTDPDDTDQDDTDPDDKDQGGTDPDGTDHGAEDMAGMDRDMGDMDDMDDMDISGPGGIPLASGAGDRDGLEMDVLHLPLGPVLAGWPPGLMVLVTLQGDVIVEVEVRQFDPVGSVDVAACRLDAATHVLALAGAGALAQRAGLARDAQLGLVPSGPELAALQRSVERSRVLRWALRHVGPIADPEEHGWPAVWAGDTFDRLLRLLGPAPGGALPAVEVDVVLAALPALLTGCELSAARLTVASLWGLAHVTSLTRQQVPT